MKRPLALLGRLVALSICVLTVLLCLNPVNADETTNISYWFSWGGYWGEEHQKIIDIFNEAHPDIKVTGLTVPGDEMIPKLLPAIAAGNPPDVVIIFGGTDAGRYPSMFTPLDEFMDRNEDMMGVQNWFPGVLEYGEFEGKQYGLPWVSSSEALYYNVELFEEAGLNPENPPVYWSDLTAVHEKLTKFNAEGEIETLGFFHPGDVSTFDLNWLPYYSYRNNGRWWDPIEKKMTCTDPANVEAWEWLQSWAAYCGPEKINRFIASISGIVAEQEGWFLQGRIAMLESGGWAIGYIDDHDPGFNFNITMMPYPENGKPVTTNYCDLMYIPRGSKNLETAWTFLSWMVTEGTVGWSAKIVETPARYDVADRLELEWKELPRYDFLRKINIDYHEYGQACLPGFPLRSIFQEQATRAYQRMHLEMISPESALEELQSVMQEELDKFYGSR